MDQLEILVREALRTIDAGRSSSIPIEKVTTLDHEVLDHSMEAAVLVSLRPSLRAFGFAGTELPEVLGCPWNYVREELHLDSSQWLAAERHVKEDDGIRLTSHV